MTRETCSNAGGPIINILNIVCESIKKQTHSESCTVQTFRCLYRWCPPLPIPNREVKPTRADGTAVTRGRVGRCQILKKALQATVRLFLFTTNFYFAILSYRFW